MKTQTKETVDTTFRVRYAETDAMGVVYHANYLVWFEVGRGEFFRSLGQDYVHWERSGYHLPVSEVHARYHAPSRFGAPVTVRTWLEHVRSRSLRLGYQVIDTDTLQRLATGWTQHICTDRNGRTRRLPEELLRSLAKHD